MIIEPSAPRVLEGLDNDNEPLLSQSELTMLLSECGEPEPQVKNIEAGNKDWRGSGTEDKADGDGNMEDVSNAAEQWIHLHQLIKWHQQLLRKGKSVITVQKL